MNVFVIIYLTELNCCMSNCIDMQWNIRLNLISVGMAKIFK